MPDSKRIVIHVNSSSASSQRVAVGAVPESSAAPERQWCALPGGGPASDYHRELKGAGLAEKAELPPAWQANAWIADRVAEELSARDKTSWDRLEAYFWEVKGDADALEERLSRLRTSAEKLGMVCEVT